MCCCRSTTHYIWLCFSWLRGCTQNQVDHSSKPMSLKLIMEREKVDHMLATGQVWTLRVRGLVCVMRCDAGSSRCVHVVERVKTVRLWHIITVWYAGVMVNNSRHYIWRGTEQTGCMTQRLLTIISHSIHHLSCDSPPTSTSRNHLAFSICRFRIRSLRLPTRGPSRRNT